MGKIMTQTALNSEEVLSQYRRMPTTNTATARAVDQNEHCDRMAMKAIDGSHDELANELARIIGGLPAARNAVIGPTTSRQSRAQPGAGKQIPLPLDLAKDTASESALRAAYKRLELSRRLTFEQVMSVRVYAIGVRNMADARMRKDSKEKQRLPSASI